MKACKVDGCPRAVFGRATVCTRCREAKKRAAWRAIKQQTRDRDLTPQQIEALLEAGDRRIKAQRHQCARRTA